MRTLLQASPDGNRRFWVNTLSCWRGEMQAIDPWRRHRSVVGEVRLVGLAAAGKLDAIVQWAMRLSRKTRRSQQGVLLFNPSAFVPEKWAFHPGYADPAISAYRPNSRIRPRAARAMRGIRRIEFSTRAMPPDACEAPGLRPTLLRGRQDRQRCPSTRLSHTCAPDVHVKGTVSPSK